MNKLSMPSTAHFVKKVQHCAKHDREYVALLLSKEGEPSRWSPCPTCAAERGAEEVLAMQRQNAMLGMQRRLGRDSIPPRFADKTFENFEAETEEQKDVLAMCQRFAGNFDKVREVGASLILCGRSGTGKTHLSAAVAHVLMEKLRSVFYVTVTDALAMVKATYSAGSDKTRDEVIRELAAPDLLVLDEVGMHMDTEDNRTILFSIINRRYEQKKPMLLISNRSEEGLREVLGEPGLTRVLERGKVKELVGENQRLKGLF